MAMIAIIALVVAGGMRLQNYTIFFILLHISAIIFHFLQNIFQICSFIGNKSFSYGFIKREEWQATCFRRIFNMRKLLLFQEK